MSRHCIFADDDDDEKKLRVLVERSKFFFLFESVASLGRVDTFIGLYMHGS